MNPAVYNEVQREYDLKRQKAINEAEKRKAELKSPALIWSGLRVSKEKTVNKRFLKAKSSEREKSEPSKRRREISRRGKTGTRTHSQRLLAGFDAP